jgi:hypothetical protein
MPSYLAAILFSLFALITAIGAWSIGAHFRSHRAGALAALVVLTFFAALAVAMWWLVTGFATG